MNASAAMTSPAGHYVSWGVIQISLTNLLFIVAMIIVFGLALVLPFPSAHDEEQPSTRDKP